MNELYKTTDDSDEDENEKKEENKSTRRSGQSPKFLEGVISWNQKGGGLAHDIISGDKPANLDKFIVPNILSSADRPDEKKRSEAQPEPPNLNDSLRTEEAFDGQEVNTDDVYNSPNESFALDPDQSDAPRIDTAEAFHSTPEKAVSVPEVTPVAFDELPSIAKRETNSEKQDNAIPANEQQEVRDHDERSETPKADTTETTQRGDAEDVIAERRMSDPAAWHGNERSSTVEVQPVRDSRVGPLAALLGLEFFARRRADRKERNEQREYVDERFKAFERTYAPNQAQRAVEQQPRELARPTTAMAEKPRVNEGQEEVRQENLALKPDQHVSHSSWHNIVLDKHGHEVVDAIEYGQGFQRERQQESRTDSPASYAASVQSSIGTPPSFPALYQQESTLPSGITQPALGNGKMADAQHRLPAKDAHPTANVNTVWLWIMILLIIAAFVTALFV